MSNPRLRIFVSSKMQELAAEREAVKAALEDLRAEAWIFEKDAGSRPGSIQQTYLEEIEEADLYIGLFWKGYGAYTIEEFEHAQALGMDCLIYEKREGSQSEREPELQAFLDRIGEVTAGLTIGRFTMAEELAKFVKADVAAWQTRTIREGRKLSSPAVYAGVPAMPTHFTGRGELVTKIVRQLRSLEDIAVEGLPGIGKTTLAVALARHPGVLRYFRDGILWASLGVDADVNSVLTRWAEYLTLQKDLTGLSGNEARAQVIRDAIGQRRMLLVLDDVWNVDTANALRCGGPHCCHLLTTRDKAIARAFGGANRAENIPTLDDGHAYALLQALAPEACAVDPEAARNLVRAVGGLPLAVHLTGGFLALPERSMLPDLSEEALAEAANPQRRLQLAERRLGVLSGEKITLQDTIGLSLEGLPDSAREAFFALGAFAPKPARFSREAAEQVAQSRGSTLALLAARNLLEIEQGGRQLALHQTIADAAHARVGDAAIARHRDHYLALVKKDRNRYDWWLIFDLFGQIKFAWCNTPDDDTSLLLDWIHTLYPYFNGRALWREYLDWARRALTAVAARGMGKEEATLLADIGVAHYYLREWQVALDHMQRAQPMLEAGGDRVGSVINLQNTGLVHYATGEKEKALVDFQQALALLEQADDRFALAEVLDNLGMVYSQMNQTLEAAAFQQQARLVSEANKSVAPGFGDDRVHLAYARRIEDMKTQRPMLLTVIESFVLLDEAEVDFEGHIALGVQREEDKITHYWHVVFAGGRKIETGYINDIPRTADAVLLMGEREADSILSGVALPENPRLLYIYGDKGLITKFSERYFRSPRKEEPEDPQKVAKKRHAMGLAFAFTRQPALAIQNYNEAIGIRIQLVERDGRVDLANDLAQSLTSRGRVFASLRRFREAVKDHDKAIEILRTLVEKDGRLDVRKDLASSFGQRAISLTADGQFPEAIRDYGSAIEIQTRLLEEGQEVLTGDLASNLSLRGISLGALGQREEAGRDLGRAIELRSRLVEQEGEGEVAVELAKDLSSRAGILNASAQYAEAVQHYDRAVEIRRRLLKKEEHEQLTHELADDLSKRAGTLSTLNQLPEACKDLDESIALHGRLIHERGRTEFEEDFANALYWSGLLHVANQQTSEGERRLVQAIELYTRMVEEQGKHKLALALAGALANYGLLLNNLGRTSEALARYSKAIETYPQVAAEPGSASHLEGLANSIYKRGSIFESLSRFQEAIRDFEAAIAIYSQQLEPTAALKADFAACLNNLAWVQSTCADQEFRDGPKAIENATRACELSDWSNYAFFDTLAAAHAEAGDFESAVQWQTKALQSADVMEQPGFRSRVELYESKRPYRQSGPGGQPSR